MSSIDAVISWVDGNDPIFQENLKSFCDLHGYDQNTVIEPTRIQQSNEIEYCLKSIARFIPWVRNVFIITNNQIPQAIEIFANTDFGKKIKIINHNDLLKKFNKTAPIFNSLSIEWLIWHIEGLSKYFIYFNDDLFLIRSLTPQDFFNKGVSKLRGSWKKQTSAKWTYPFKKILKTKRDPHRSWQEKSAKLAGWDKKFFSLEHAPFPLNKTTFDNFLHNEFAYDLFLQNISIPFRHPDHTSSIPLMLHLDMQYKRAQNDKSLKAIAVNGAVHSFKKIKSRLKKAANDPQVAFVCMQSMEQAKATTQAYLINWLQQNIG